MQGIAGLAGLLLFRFTLALLACLSLPAILLLPRGGVLGLALALCASLGLDLLVGRVGEAEDVPDTVGHVGKVLLLLPFGCGGQRHVLRVIGRLGLLSFGLTGFWGQGLQPLELLLLCALGVGLLALQQQR